MLLEATNISYRPGPRFSLESISIASEGPSLTSIIGPNGAGKTTLIRILAGLLAPDSGEVRLENVDVHQMTAFDRAQRIAYVSQMWRPTFEFTVEQTILLGRTPWRRRYGGFETDSDLQSAEEAIELLDLEGLRHVPVTELSGGELQRTLIGIALAQQTDVLLLDEPTTHLDIARSQELLELLRQVASRRGTIIMASVHDLNLASIYSDAVVMMQGGRIVGAGTPTEVMTASNIRTAFEVDVVIEAGRYGGAPGIALSTPRSRQIHAG